MRFQHPFLSLALLAVVTTAACSDDDGGGENENEVITTITLTFTPTGGGTPVVATFNDADGDGGAAPTIDSINLVKATTYTASIKYENRLETPAENITVEIEDESDEHQIFFTGTAVNGPASNRPGAPLTHTYADTDANGLPIGLANSFIAATGTGNLIVTLRHMPPVNGTAVKDATAATKVRDAGGFLTLGGSTDAEITYPVSVP